jgi:hypothetical protein
MIGLVISLAAVPVLLAAALIVTMAGIRAGDRPGDVTVTARMGRVEHPEGCWRVVVATVRNPGPEPVLVGLSVRGTVLPSWLGSGLTVAVPRRTTRRRLRPGRQAVLGVTGPGATGQWQVPVATRLPRCRLVAVAGQAGRLRVLGVPVAAQGPGPRLDSAQPGLRQPGC